MREQHSISMGPAQTPVECPKCGTKQIISEAPGRRVCIRCGYEFRPQIQKV